MDSIQRTGCAVFPDPVAGPRPHQLDRTLAAISSDVYRDPGSSIAGWAPVVDGDLERLGIDPTVFHDRLQGFHARLYRNADEYVLAFRGTDGLEDWLSNFRQGIGLPDRQYERATWAAGLVKDALGERLLAHTGHSLGAGLAAIASLRTSTPAVTFNAAGVHDATLERIGIAPEARHVATESGQIRRYTVDNDLLTELQEHAVETRTFLSDAIGHRIRLPDPDPLSVLDRLVPGQRIKHALDAHSMDSVIAALDSPGQPAAGAAKAAALVVQSLQGMRRLRDASQLPPMPGDGMLNAAAFLAAHALRSGVDRIDHMVCSTNGEKLFAIQGSPGDPSQRRVTVDIAAAASEPVHRSVAATPGAGVDAPRPLPIPRVDLQQMHFVMSGH